MENPGIGRVLLLVYVLVGCHRSGGASIGCWWHFVFVLCWSVIIWLCMFYVGETFLVLVLACCIVSSSGVS